MGSEWNFEDFYRHLTRDIQRQVAENGSRVLTLVPNPEGAVAVSPSPSLEIPSDVAKVAELLECPVCLNTLNPPIFLCPSSHSVCCHCRKMLEACPMCRLPFTGMRDRFAEKYLDLCMIPCKNGGCSVKLPGSQLSEHYSTCEFGPLVCPCCREKVSYENFIRHVEVDCEWELEPVARSPKVECIFNQWNNSSAWDKPIWISAFNRHFFCFCKKFEGNWSIWLCLLGTEEECDEFSCKISVVKKTDQSEVAYEGPVHPLRKCLADEVRGLTIPDGDLHKLYVQEDGDLCVTVRIVKEM